MCSVAQPAVWEIKQATTIRLYTKPCVVLTLPYNTGVERKQASIIQARRRLNYRQTRSKQTLYHLQKFRDKILSTNPYSHNPRQRKIKPIHKPTLPRSKGGRRKLNYIEKNPQCRSWEIWIPIKQSQQLGTFEKISSYLSLYISQKV